MKIHNWKNNELNRLLMEKFGFGQGKPAEDEWSKKQEIVAEIEFDVIAAEAAKLEAKCKEGDEQACAELRELEGSVQGIGHMHENEDAEEEEVVTENEQENLEAEEAEEEEEVNESEAVFRGRIRSMVEEILKLK